MTNRLFLSSISIAVLALAAGPAGQPSDTVAFTNVAVVPMDTNRVLSNHTVVVTRDRITALGPANSTRVPEGAVQVDGKGKYLMPGLAEMHGHIPPPTAPKEQLDAVLFLYVANGVTTVRGMLGAAGQLELREAAKRGDVVAPHLYLAGPSFSGATVKMPQEAVARVRQQKAEGWNLLKVHPGLTRPVYDAMATTAKEVGIPFAGHVPADVGILHAIETGQLTVDHLDGFAEQLDGLAKPIDDKPLKDLVAKARQRGTWMVPTMVVWETLQGPVTLESRTGWPELKYLPATQVAQWTRSLDSRLKGPQFNAEQAKIYIDNRMRILKALDEGGARMLLGSDAPQQFNVPGFSIHREMQRMADAGMSAYDIVRSGTTNVGEYFKAEGDFGTVAVGKRADLILVDANPLQSVANMEKRSGVMVGGRWLPQSTIETRLAQIAAASAAQ